MLMLMMLCADDAAMLLPLRAMPPPAIRQRRFRYMRVATLTLAILIGIHMMLLRAAAAFIRCYACHMLMDMPMPAKMLRRRLITVTLPPFSDAATAADIVYAYAP